VIATDTLLSFVVFMYEAGVELSPVSLRSRIGLLYQPRTIYGDGCESVGMNE
jgi:hypothetical protein